MYSPIGRSAYSAYSSRDLQDYRANYPNNADDPRKDKNLRFFRDEYPLQPEGVMITEVLNSWKGRYRHLEGSHSFIQWLFPIQEKGMNYDSQVLQKHEIAAMREDPLILERVVGLFRIMLDFYGMALVDVSAGRIERLEDYTQQYRNLNTSSHNYLRITRILKHLGEMGMEDLKIGWLECLFYEICIVRLLPNCESSFWNYWTGTIYADDTREAFLKHCEAERAKAVAARKAGRPVPTREEVFPRNRSGGADARSEASASVPRSGEDAAAPISGGSVCREEASVPAEAIGATAIDESMDGSRAGSPQAVARSPSQPSASVPNSGSE